MKSKIMTQSFEHTLTYLALSVAPPYFLPLKAVASNLVEIVGIRMVDIPGTMRMLIIILMVMIIRTLKRLQSSDLVEA